MKAWIFLIFLLGIISCSEDDDPCLDERIAQFKMQQADCQGASIIRYSFQGKTLIGFSDGICISDGGATLVDESCDNFCFIGGIAALTDCNGENFHENAQQLETIWINQ